MTMIRLLFLTSCLLFFMTATAFTQSKKVGTEQDRRRFKADLILGLYATQIDGDNFVGYDKAGLSGGVRGIAVLNKRFDMNIELLYQQKGSRFETEANGSKDRILHLDYMEVPFLIRYYPTSKNQGMNLAIGVAFSRLIGTSVTERELPDRLIYETLVEDFSSNETSFIAEVALKLTPRINVGGRYSFSFSRFYDNPEGIGPIASTQTGGRSTERIFYLRNYMLGGYVAYSF